MIIAIEIMFWIWYYFTLLIFLVWKRTPKLLAGIRSFKIPPLNPLMLQEVSIDEGSGPVSINLKLNNLRVEGGQHYKVNSVRWVPLGRSQRSLFWSRTFSERKSSSRPPPPAEAVTTQITYGAAIRERARWFFFLRVVDCGFCLHVNFTL